MLQDMNVFAAFTVILNVAISLKFQNFECQTIPESFRFSLGSCVTGEVFFVLVMVIGHA